MLVTSAIICGAVVSVFTGVVINNGALVTFIGTGTDIFDNVPT